MKPLRSTELVIFLLALATTLLPLAAYADDDEVTLGKQAALALEKKGEILENSPYYQQLDPIATRIAVVANPQYEHPFHFILVHEEKPNAFAVPGGSIFVTDSLMAMIENSDELAAVLCHETSHDIHHDVVHNMKKNRNLSYASSAIGMLLGGFGGTILSNMLNVGTSIESMQFSREVETQADLKGAETCSAAGFNPWGMVWLLTRFEKNGNENHMEILSDHPTDDHRIAKLKELFASDPERYDRYPARFPHGSEKQKPLRKNSDEEAL